MVVVQGILSVFSVVITVLVFAFQECMRTAFTNLSSFFCCFPMDTSISTITVPLLPDTISVRRKERLFGHNYSTFGAPRVHSSGLRKWVCGALLLFVLVIAGYLVCIRKADGYTDHQSSIPASMRCRLVR